MTCTSASSCKLWRCLLSIVIIASIGAHSFVIRGGGNARRVIQRDNRREAQAIIHQGPSSTRLYLQLDLSSFGGEENDENSDFYNPENIQEGDTVEVIKDSVFYSIPKTPKEGVHTKGFKGTVAQLKFAAKNGVMCSANRPVVVKFTEPYKFQGHFEFKELKKC